MVGRGKRLESEVPRLHPMDLVVILSRSVCLYLPQYLYVPTHVLLVLLLMYLHLS